MVDVQKIPTLGAASFTCPHCGAVAHQTWYRCQTDQFDKESPPEVLTEAEIEERLQPVDAEIRNSIRAYLKKIASGAVFLENFGQHKYVSDKVVNLTISRCYSCGNCAVWIYDRILWPASTLGAPKPHPDLPDEIRLDYEEAARALDVSPRGAAALLRLAIQKICRELGESGKDLNADIGSLVAKGLSHQIQLALDIVRVIGNEAVHPGQVDLRDDRATATELFNLVNLIVDEMIGRPNRLKEMYDSLPLEKRKQIEKRDQKSYPS
jgi:hypothetical protein